MFKRAFWQFSIPISLQNGLICVECSCLLSTLVIASTDFIIIHQKSSYIYMHRNEQKYNMQMIDIFEEVFCGFHDLDQIFRSRCMKCIRSPAVRHLLRHQLPSLDLRDPGCSDLGCHLGLEPEARQGPKGPKMEICRELVPPKNGANLAGEVGNARNIMEYQ